MESDVKKEQQLGSVLTASGLSTNDIEFILRNQIVANRLVRLLQQEIQAMRDHLEEVPLTKRKEPEALTSEVIKGAISELQSRGRKITQENVGIQLGYAHGKSFRQQLYLKRELLEVYRTAQRRPGKEAAS